MKIHLCSDLHLEFRNTYFPEVEADTIIIAGDVYPNTEYLIDYLRVVSSYYKHVIFVPGNHDYYGNDIVETNVRLANEFSNTNVHILHNERIELDGVSFYGGTMWTEGYGNCDRILEDSVNDFRLIRNFSVSRMRELHEVFKQGWQDADVVISHHVPDSLFTEPRFRGSVLNGAFSCSDMKDYLTKPKFWCFGHTHASYFDKIGNTQFICNPMGYPGEQNSFNKDLVFTV